MAYEGFPVRAPSVSGVLWKIAFLVLFVVVLLAIPLFGKMGWITLSGSSPPLDTTILSDSTRVKITKVGEVHGMDVFVLRDAKTANEFLVLCRGDKSSMAFIPPKVVKAAE